MNLQQSMDVIKLLKEGKDAVVQKKKMSALELASHRLLLAEVEGRALGPHGYTPHDFADNILASSNFKLMNVSLSKIACPGPKFGNHLVHRILAEGVATVPIVIDANIHKIGRSPKTGFVPKVIVVDGKERFEAAVMNGEEKIPAWVGNLAAERLSIYADHQMSAQELEGLVKDAINRDLNIDWKKQTSLGPYDSMPWIRENYPLENYCVYTWKSKLYRQKYLVDMEDRNVTLVGPPKEVVQKYVDKKDAVKVSTIMNPGTIASSMQACACQPKAAETVFATKDGKPIATKELLRLYNSSIRAGTFVVGDVEAKSPPGWKKSVEKMKDHDEIDNPWALAWWMDDQGYSPHHKERKGK